MIPKTIIRSVPAETTDEVEGFWKIVEDLHPGWELITFRDPINPGMFPTTSPLWPLCKSGAQLAGLVRLEALWLIGGFWLDSDVELFRPLDELLKCEVYAAWEDDNVVPDAVMAAEAGHPVIAECLALACQRIQSTSTDWRDGNGAWSTGPGVTTSILPLRAGVTLGPPESFYPYHYTEKHRRHEDHRGPLTFGAHHWAGSWL